MHIGVVAKFRIKEGFVDAVYKELVKLHASTHEFDEGCIQYDLHQDIEDAQTFIFVETWENAQRLAEHEVQEHFLECIANIEDKLEVVEISKTHKKL